MPAKNSTTQRCNATALGLKSCTRETTDGNGLCDGCYAQLETAQPQVNTEKEIARLRDRLNFLEVGPEFEATAFQLKTRIYRLERQVDVDEWPEFIAIGGEVSRLWRRGGHF